MKDNSIINKIVIVVQFSLLGAKLTGLVTWHWVLVLIPLELFIAVILICVVMYFLATVYRICLELIFYFKFNGKSKNNKKEEMEEQVIRAYTLGESIDDIALEFDLTNGEVYKIVSAYRKNKSDNNERH